MGDHLEVVALGASDAQQSEQVVEKQRVITAEDDENEATASDLEQKNKAERMKESAHRQRQLDVPHMARALVVGQPARGAAAEGEEGEAMHTEHRLRVRPMNSSGSERVCVCLPEGVQGAHGRVVEAALDRQLGTVKRLQVCHIADADAAHFIGGEQLE